VHAVSRLRQAVRGRRHRQLEEAMLTLLQDLYLYVTTKYNVDSMIALVYVARCAMLSEWLWFVSCSTCVHCGIISHIISEIDVIIYFSFPGMYVCLSEMIFFWPIWHMV
ncbi:unnamed protein product, partial [Urochloa humidicola]